MRLRRRRFAVGYLQEQSVREIAALCVPASPCGVTSLCGGILMRERAAGTSRVIAQTSDPLTARHPPPPCRVGSTDWRARKCRTRELVNGQKHGQQDGQQHGQVA
jgi:hypothetical protein